MNARMKRTWFRTFTKVKNCCFSRREHHRKWSAYV